MSRLIVTTFGEYSFEADLEDSRTHVFSVWGQLKSWMLVSWCEAASFLRAVLVKREGGFQSGILGLSCQKGLPAAERITACVCICVFVRQLWNSKTEPICNLKREKASLSVASRCLSPPTCSHVIVIKPQCPEVKFLRLSVEYHDAHFEGRWHFWQWLFYDLWNEPFVVRMVLLDLPLD